MNAFYESFIDRAKRIAAERGLSWNIPVDADGKVDKEARWDLAKLCGLPTPPYFWVSSLGIDKTCLDLKQHTLPTDGGNQNMLMPSDWRDFYLAAVLNEVAIKRNKPRHALENVGRPIRILAGYAADEAPWRLSASTVTRAYNGALSIGESGKIAANLAMVVRTTIDGYHISENYPLESYCKATGEMASLASADRVSNLKLRNNTYRNTTKVRAELSSRKASNKLPDAKAFAELLRIVFTEQPQSFSDAIRFSQIKVAIITGLRIGENVMLPVDWAHWQEHLDASGRPADASGGISRSLSIRHFAEKQSESISKDGITLYENLQHVPILLEDALVETLEHTERITRPLRARLRKQVQTERLFPEYEPQDLVPLFELYVRMTGSLRISKMPLQPDLVSSYRSSLESSILEELYESQVDALDTDGPSRGFRDYWDRLSEKYGLEYQRLDGTSYRGKGLVYGYLRVGDIENFIRKNIQSKVSDTGAFNLANDETLCPSELMFLMPVRGLADDRDGGILDVNRYFAVGRSQTSDLQLHLGGRANANIFTRYGKTPEDRALSLNTHSLRHLQNAELFRLDVSDAIITKRFNRRSVAQSYVYDHRSLSEDLAAIDIPDSASSMAPNSKEVLRLILANRVKGPIIDEFVRVQRELGDDAAFAYLSAEADGLHVTPYGFCVNSFTVDPCPKHLECFNGCRHLTRTPLQKEKDSLELLRQRMIKVIDVIESTPDKLQKLGWQNQLSHARIRLENISKAIASAPGESPFPDGEDLYQSANSKLGTTILDIKPKIWRPE